MALRVYARVRVEGALFDARGRRIFTEFQRDLEEDGAEWALDHIRGTFHAHFKQPTGYYESHVRISNSTHGLRVEDGGNNGPVYGPWLEGVGSRNNTTRFKGYHAFRNAAHALQQRFEGMGERLLSRNVIRRL